MGIKPRVSVVVLSHDVHWISIYTIVVCFAYNVVVTRVHYVNICAANQVKFAHEPTVHLYIFSPFHIDLCLKLLILLLVNIFSSSWTADVFGNHIDNGCIFFFYLYVSVLCSVAEQHCCIVLYYSANHHHYYLHHISGSFIKSKCFKMFRVYIIVFQVVRWWLYH